MLSLSYSGAQVPCGFHFKNLQIRVREKINLLQKPQYTTELSNPPLKKPHKK